MHKIVIFTSKKTIAMIPQEFQEYFKGSDKGVQQGIIDTLLGFMDSPSGITGQTGIRAISCPHCESEKLRANGKLKQVQRYVCNGCGKNFSETTGKVLYNLKKKDKINLSVLLAVRLQYP